MGLGTSAFPGRGGRIARGGPGCQTAPASGHPSLSAPLSKPRVPANCAGMDIRSDILVLGLTAGVVGSLVGGLMLGVGLGLVVQGVHAAWLLVLPAAPASGMFGYLLAKRLVARLRADGLITGG